MHLLPHHQPAARGGGARRGPPGVCVSVCTFILSPCAAAASDLRRTECHRGRLLTPDKVRRPPRACAGPSRGLPSARREQDEMGSASALCKPSDTQVSGGRGAEAARRLTFHAVCFWAPTSVPYAWVAYAVTRSRGAPALASPRCAVLFLWMVASSDGTLGSRTPFLLQDQNSHVL